MFISNCDVDSTVLKTANAERFINLRQQRKLKSFLLNSVDTNVQISTVLFWI